MTTKAKRTTEFIIKTVAPIFTKHGYVGTSMSDLTEATGLTKGAIYGNFENKESLALSAFQHQITLLLDKLDDVLNVEGKAIDKILNLIKFYKNYSLFTNPIGGCPVLNVGVDARHNNHQLSAAVSEIIKTIEGKIAVVFENGVNQEEFRLPVTPLQFAKQLYTMIQGAVAMSTMTQDHKYLLNTLVYLEHLVKEELKN